MFMFRAGISIRAIEGVVSHKSPPDFIKNMINKFEELPEVLTIYEVAYLFRVSNITIKRWTKRGRLKGIKINERGDWRYLKSHIKLAMEYYG